MVLMPIFNSGNFINSTLISVINQTEEVDILIVDNFSSEETFEIVKNVKNIGYIANWNRCLEIAIAKEKPYFKLLFAGEVLKNKVFEEYKRVFDNGYMELITSKYKVVENNGIKNINQTIAKEKSFTSKETVELNLQKRNWYISPNIQVFRTESIKDIRFNEKRSWIADWKFFINLSKLIGVYYIDKLLTEFHKDSRKYFDLLSNKLSSLTEEVPVITNLIEELKLTSIYEKQIKDFFHKNVVGNLCNNIKDIYEK